MAQIDLDELPDEIKSAIVKHQEEKAAASRGGGRSENLEVVIDLSDEAAVSRGLELGFLKKADLDDAGDEGDDGDDDAGKGKAKPAAKGEKAPRRKGYFDTGDGGE